MPDDAHLHERPGGPNVRPAAASGHDISPHRRPTKPRHLKLIGILVTLVCIATVAWGVIVRRNAEASLTKWTAAQAVPAVSVAHPTTSAAQRTLSLPGDVEAFYEAPIYARVSGYLHMWYVDIGTRVQFGQRLATIETPDLDQQLSQAQADLASARANQALADLTAKRWRALLASNSVSRQSVDEKEGAAAAGRAAVHAQQAHVDQLSALEGFKQLSAPFAGVVTARNTDIGALINAGSTATEPLFKVADVHRMRVYVHVPQSYASELRAGMAAHLTQPQYPGKIFNATLATTSQSVNAASRTVLVELMADNPAGELWTGTYATVKFDLPPDQGVLRVPASALIFRAAGAQLATLGPRNDIVMKRVTIGRNLGQEIEITSGITPSDRIVTTPLDTLVNGQEVQVVANMQAAD